MAPGNSVTAGKNNLRYGALFIFLMGVGCSATQELHGISEVQSVRSSALSSACLKIGGRYSLLGSALPGMPSYFRFRAVPLTLDVMLGQDLPDEKLKNVKDVEIVQEEGNFEVIFRQDQQSIERRKLIEPGDSVQCFEGELKIYKIRESSGEAVRRISYITHTFSPADDGSLIVTTEITGRSTTFFFFSFRNVPEKYGAKYVQTQSTR